MKGNYWERTVLHRRISRRRALAGGASLGIGALAASLVACGGGDDGDKSATSDKSGLVAEPVDTTKQAVKGGIWPQVVTSDAVSFDSMAEGGLRPLDEASHVYSRLLRYKLGTFDNPSRADIEPDAAISWELSPDQTQVTLKLRPNMKYDPRPPTNGRALDSGDVKFSWERFAKISVSRGDASNAVNPDAPIVSMQAPDASTVVVKLAFPYAPLLKMLAYFWWVPIFPVEAEGGYDPKRDMHGTGAWMLTKYEPSVVYEYRKNPNFWDIANRPLLDGKDRYIVPEYATGLAQLLAGRIFNYAAVPGTGRPLVRPEDVVRTKRQEPRLVMIANEALVTSRNQFVLGFSGRDNSPLLDERVRRAASMLIDRAAWIDVFFNVSGFAKDGITVETRWQSHIPSGHTAYWLDPQGDKLGEGAKYFKHDPLEAKKLLDGAGQFGVETDYTYFPSGGYPGQGSSIARNMEVLRDMLAGEGHFKLKSNVVDYNTVVTPKYTFAKADFDGISVLPSPSYPDIDTWLYAVYSPNGRNAWVKNPMPPKILELMQRQRRETDEQKRVGILHDLQRDLALQMPDIPFPGSAQGFDLFWPILGNYGYYQSYDPVQSGAQELDSLIWYDKSKQTS